MLGWAIAFFVLAIVAAVLGFGGIAGASACIAQILFFVFLALLVLSFVVRAVNGRSVTRAGHKPHEIKGRRCGAPFLFCC